MCTSHKSSRFTTLAKYVLATFESNSIWRKIHSFDNSSCLEIAFIKGAVKDAIITGNFLESEANTTFSSLTQKKRR